MDFETVVVASDRKIETSRKDKQKNLLIRPDFSLIHWNYFIAYHLYDVIQTDHVLIIQPDGFACNRNLWDDEFLNYDFIASPVCSKLPKVEATLNTLVVDTDSSQVNRPFIFNGGGGFSLRSKKFLEFTKNMSNKEKEGLIINKEGLSITSEDFLCSLFFREKAEQIGLKYADLSTTFKFSCEDIFNYGLSFGFHGFHNVPLFMDEYETLYIMDFMSLNKMKFFGSLQSLESNLIIKRYDHALEKLNYIKKSSY